MGAQENYNLRKQRLLCTTEPSAGTFRSSLSIILLMMEKIRRRAGPHIMRQLVHCVPKSSRPTPSSIDNFVTSQRIFKIISLTASLVNLP